MSTVEAPRWAVEINGDIEEYHRTRASARDHVAWLRNHPSWRPPDDVIRVVRIDCDHVWGGESGAGDQASRQCTWCGMWRTEQGGDVFYTAPEPE